MKIANLRQCSRPAVRFDNINSFLSMDAYKVCTNLSSTSTGLGRFLGRPGPRLAGMGAGLLAGAWFVRVKQGAKDSSDICIDGAVRDGLE